MTQKTIFLLFSILFINVPILNSCNIADLLSSRKIIQTRPTPTSAITLQIIKTDTKSFESKIVADGQIIRSCDWAYPFLNEIEIIVRYKNRPVKFLYCKNTWENTLKALIKTETTKENARHETSSKKNIEEEFLLAQRVEKFFKKKYSSHILGFSYLPACVCTFKFFDNGNITMKRH